jgi:hypothetical protein
MILIVLINSQSLEVILLGKPIDDHIVTIGHFNPTVPEALPLVHGHLGLEVPDALPGAYLGPVAEQLEVLEHHNVVVFPGCVDVGVEQLGKVFFGDWLHYK